ncbi:hypothetical protein ACN38_g10642 [Penicillium nordicum]|uniref:Uncharacterized protein n=1 Tax=Penicillium nordicum TaxID=229535 RepID=A0A0M8NSJ3_9EURO|nr:hypothetical protein ACN38_g10642 [Penicillium nordicum]
MRRNTDDILRPARPEALRVYGHNTTADNGCWLRLCYTDEEGHNALWSANKLAEWVTYDGIVLDDESIFGGLDLAAALEVFPERVDERVNFEIREESLRDAIEVAEEGDWDENPLEPYALYQADCVVTHMYVEDDVAVNGGGLLHVFLDDRGNVVRQWRVQDDGSENNYDGAWFERVWKGDFEAQECSKRFCPSTQFTASKAKLPNRAAGKRDRDLPFDLKKIFANPIGEGVA